MHFEIGGIDCRIITAEFRKRVHCIHVKHLICNTVVHAIYSVVAGPYSFTISSYKTFNTRTPTPKKEVAMELVCEPGASSRFETQEGLNKLAIYIFLLDMTYVR